MSIYIRKFLFCSGRVGCVRFVGAVLLAIIVLTAEGHSQSTVSALPPGSWWQSALQALVEHLGPLLVAIVMGILALFELRSIRRTTEERVKVDARRLEDEQIEREKRLAFEERRFKAEELEREKRL